MAPHDLWESGKSWCVAALFFRADSSSLKAGSPNTVCLTVTPIVLNTKTAKKRKRSGCSCLARSSSIISIAGGVPGLRGPAWLAGLQRVHVAGQSHPQARSGRLSPTVPRWQRHPCLWGRPLCSRCHCPSHFLRHLQYITKHKQGTSCITNIRFTVTVRVKGAAHH